jgi:uncharacterized repeat protein (TIGR03803 family)
MAAVVLGLVFYASIPLQAQKFKVLYRFQGGTDGDAPLAGLVADANGNLYGTTEVGGGNSVCDYFGPGCGTVFKLAPNGAEIVLHRFTGMPDGAYPFAGIVIDNSGNLYGTAYAGGAFGYGAVFGINSSGQESIIYSFGPLPDGQYPSAGVTLGTGGTIYGTTQQGGTGEACWGNCGTVFELSNTGEETVLFNFNPPAEAPTAALTLGVAGSLYGTTSGNGYCCLGTVFAISDNIASEAITLHDFTVPANGADPTGALVRDGRGHFYGITHSGGDMSCASGFGSGCGIVYELDPAGKETVLHRFTGGRDGACPYAGLLRDNSGNLYGTTLIGGAFNYGTVFKLDEHGKLTVLHSFNKKDGWYPSSTLIQDAAGNLYGTTQSGGDLSCNNGYGCGVIFEITP